MSDSEEHLRMQLVEARTDTKFAQVLGEMRAGFAAIDGRFAAIDGRFAAIDARLTGVERATSGLKATIVGTGVAVVAVMIGILTYGHAWFGIGVSTRDIVRATVTEYLQQHPPVAPVAPTPPSVQPAPPPKP